MSDSRRPRPAAWGRLPLALAIALGALAGMGLYTFRFAEGLSYFSTEPSACANCHIMQPQYDSWQKSSHHTIARCVDCHLPHTFLRKYVAKAANGYHHSKGFTLQDFHEPIFIKEPNSRILQENCVRCHEPLVHDLLDARPQGPAAPRCVHCHQGVGHGEAAGLGGPERADVQERNPDHE
jgi:cytochrome c nitrite reductase small subunit